jgi:lipid-binding SYLF domain-containing protein
MRRRLVAAVLAATTAAAPAFAILKEERRLAECREVLLEVMGMPESIPRDLLDKAECVVVIPGVKKAALGVGGRLGRGAIVCRTDEFHGRWGAPLMVHLGGASIGFQIGGQSGDYVFLIMNPRGIDHLLNSKVTLGADATVAAGPKGRSAEAATDAQMHAEILTYSRTRGLFAGVSLEGAVLKQDKDANEEVYGVRVEPRDVLLREAYPVPEVGKDLVRSLEDLSPRNNSK